MYMCAVCTITRFEWDWNGDTERNCSVLFENIHEKVCAVFFYDPCTFWNSINAVTFIFATYGNRDSSTAENVDEVFLSLGFLWTCFSLCSPNNFTFNGKWFLFRWFLKHRSIKLKSNLRTTRVFHLGKRGWNGNGGENTNLEVKLRLHSNINLIHLKIALFSVEYRT